MKVKTSLNLATTNNAQILIDADQYTNNMTDNPKFAEPYVVAQVVSTKSAAGGLKTALNSPTADNKSDMIKIQREILDRNLSKLANMVEDIANDPSTPDANRFDIIHSAGMTVRNRSIPPRRQFSVSNGELTCSVSLTAAGGAKAHEWQYTTDVASFSNRISADSTTTAKTTIFGLKKATEYAFFHKAIYSGEKTDWEGPLFLIVV